MSNTGLLQSVTRKTALVFWSLLALGAAPAVAFQQPDRPDVTAEEAARRPDHVQVRVVGRVYEVSRDGRSFRVEAGDVSFSVEPGFATRLPRLRDGDRVMVTGTLRSQTRLTATDVRVLGSADSRAVTGRVRDHDRRRTRLTVDSERGTSVEVRYDADTVFARLGRKVTPDQVQVGDEVWADGRWLDTRSLRATRVEVTASRDRWQSGQAGEIASVSRRDRRLSVAFGEETRLVIVSPETSISRGATRVPFDSLLQGDRIRVSGELRNDEIVARSIEVIDRRADTPPRTLEGRVRSVDVDGRVIRVTVNSIIPITVPVYVPQDIQISRGTRRLSLADIREGDRIRARGPSRDSGVQAETIEVLP